MELSNTLYIALLYHLSACNCLAPRPQSEKLVLQIPLTFIVAIDL
jgi:hypothetical protein